MKRFLLLAKIVSFFLIVLRIAFADNSAVLNKTLMVRHSVGKEKVRLVVETESKPLYEVYQEHNPERITVDIFNAEAGEKLELKKEVRDHLLAGWEFYAKNFRQLSWSIKLHYAVPSDNIKIFHLKSPSRLVIDIKRDFEVKSSYPLTPYVRWERRETGSPDGYLLINKLKINPASPTVNLDVALAEDNIRAREKTSSIAARKSALAAVNGGFFARGGGPLGLVVIDGEMKTPPVKFRPPRTAVGMTREKNIHIARIKMDDGKLKDADGKKLPEFLWAIGCGPRIIKDGKKYINAKEEALAKGGNDITKPSGRTAVGILGKGEILLLTLTGFKSNHLQGATLDKLAEIMLKEGAVQAMALDGGDSSTMVIEGEVISNGPGNRSIERKVADALLVFDTSAPVSPGSIEIKMEKENMPADGASSNRIKFIVKDRNGKFVADRTPINLSSSWGMIPSQVFTKGGEAEIEIISPRKTGVMNITAAAGSIRQTASIQFIPGKPSFLSGRIIPVKSDAKCSETFLIEALLTDEFMNPLGGQEVKVCLKEGECSFDSLSAITDENGVAKIALQIQSARVTVEILSGDLKPIIVEYIVTPPDR